MSFVLTGIFKTCPILSVLLVKLFNDFNSLTVILYFLANLFNKSGDYRAFLMPFYKSSSKDVLTRSSDYLTDNFSEIFDSFGPES